MTMAETLRIASRSRTGVVAGLGAFVALSFLAGPAAFAEEEGRVMVWRGECCEKATPSGEGSICKEVNIQTHCCVSRAQQCQTGCGIDFESNQGMRDACEELCQSHGTACMDEGPIAGEDEEE